MGYGFSFGTTVMVIGSGIDWWASGDLDDNTESVYRLLLDADESTPTQNRT